MEDCVSDKYDPSVIVDLKDDSQRHISNTVSVKNRNKLRIKVRIQFIYLHKRPCRICFTNLNQKFQIMTVRIASNCHLLQRKLWLARKSDRLCLARGAIENKIHLTQNKQFLVLSPFMGYKAIYMMQILTLYVQIFCICTIYYARMVDIIMRAYK